MDGILNINKPLGMTSHDVVARVRKIAHQKRVGHTGTLDPAASGVLPICLGIATRVAEYLSESGKAYRACVHLGVVTDTYDVEGTVLRTADASTISQAQIEEQLQTFLGWQEQMPPSYSAIKIKGQPAYKLARAGQEVTLTARRVQILHLELISWEAPYLTLDVECSKGTYIRSLAYDLGEKLGCGGSLAGLERTRSGPFTLADCISLEEFAEAVEGGRGESYLAPLDLAVREYPALHVDEQGRERVGHGNTLGWEHLSGERLDPPYTLARIYDQQQERILALATWDQERQVWQPSKVFI